MTLYQSELGAIDFSSVYVLCLLLLCVLMVLYSDTFA
uniref:Uncharacterized protein n=1 Tax=Arundo donax TaxID=35708 RepID=A0A0A9AFM4_ARUDO